MHTSWYSRLASGGTLCFHQKGAAARGDEGVRLPFVYFSRFRWPSAKITGLDSIPQAIPSLGGEMPWSSTASRIATTSATSGPTDHWSVARSATVDSLSSAGTPGGLSSLRVGELHRSPVVVGFSFSYHCAFVNSSDSLALPFANGTPALHL